MNLLYRVIVFTNGEVGCQRSQDELPSKRSDLLDNQHPSIVASLLYFNLTKPPNVHTPIPLQLELLEALAKHVDTTIERARNILRTMLSHIQLSESGIPRRISNIFVQQPRGVYVLNCIRENMA